MNDIWSWQEYGDVDREDVGQEDVGREDEQRNISSQLNRDIVGYDVDATDGSIGKIDEATFDIESSYLVIDTGWWIFGKKRLVPAGFVTGVDDSARVVHVSCDKEAIKAAPDYDPDEWNSDHDSTVRTRHGDYYGGL